jgi:hypothetical protein
MKYKQQDSKVCMHYVADRLIRITEISDRRKMETAIEEFKEEMVYNLGINSMHNHYGEKDDQR